MDAAVARPISPRALRITAEGPRLVGGRCQKCGAVYFPVRGSCRRPGCGSRTVEPFDLSPHGRLWSFTVQHYQPPPPFVIDDPFQPYAIGLVDLPEGIRVLASLRSDDLDTLAIGQPVRLTTRRLRSAADGSDVCTWQFEPAPEED